MLDQYGDVLNIAELQEILGIGRNSAYALVASGEIAGFRIGKKWRVSKDALLAYLGRWKHKKA